MNQRTVWLGVSVTDLVLKAREDHLGYEEILIALVGPLIGVAFKGGYTREQLIEFVTKMFEETTKQL